MEIIRVSTALAHSIKTIYLDVPPDWVCVNIDGRLVLKLKPAEAEALGVQLRLDVIEMDSK